ncbi:tyrosine-type recombinase/integrase [Ectothiorhodospira variabilis]|uniref:tyrosine-type recombinase/integrase n=1 Tax=Ectothiorhodospira variabilis TaxID=505694 RepID=UPI001EFB1E05|nr:tyrosine-type recombinase/integrase [Ectothiorhodospira variabilis]MCG5495956.1 tyrosine-type recombinase/integrase [Ectothiorhodospira variabilis]MCG5498499.1 tyrosine-type recombinase/integrase [Ectothiorhodospira variabilis]MCG5505330.1 tyrosine-type recombinase/integrase [Ectothiorhodospira variabilis]MCG5508516.1 tyrosine-type recombinase/integrase [Ectothiorhodospira variabilis]
MSDVFGITHPETAQRGSWTSLRDLFRHHLIERGYALGTARMYEQAILQYERWAWPEPVAAIDAASVEEFLAYFRESWTKHQPSQLEGTVRAALRQLLKMLGRPIKRPLWCPESSHMVALYDAYMADVAGLGESTRRYRRREAGNLLNALVSEGQTGLWSLSPSEVRDYVRERVEGLKPKSVGVISVAIRSFLRYGHLCGHCGPELARSVPGAASSCTRRLPKAFDPEVLRQLPASFDLTRATGQRDYAMCRVLMDLGIRTDEAARLQLDDIDWHRGTVTVPAGKSGRSNTLPLPSMTGEAIVAYLRGGRPRTQSRALFVHHRSRSGYPVTAATVRAALRAAFRRIGLPDSLSQVHRLRHSVATRLLETGTPLKSIADVLGHLSYDTTAGYLSVDVGRLRKVAMPWPENMS